MALVPQIEAMTQKYFDRKITSQVVFSDPLFFKIFSRSKSRSLSGRKYVWEPRFGRKTTHWIGRYAVIPRAPVEHVTEAQVNVVRNVTSAVLDKFDINENSGRERIIDMVATELEVLKDDAIYNNAYELWNGDGSANKFEGVNKAVNVTAEQTYANIAYADASWWDNARVDGAGAAVTLTLLEQAKLAGEHGRNKIDLWVTSKQGYRRLYTVAVTAQQLTTPTTKAGKQLAALGFGAIEVDGVPVVWSDFALSGDVAVESVRYYGFTTKDIELRYVKGYKMKREPWKELESQPVLVTDMFNHCALAFKTRRNHTLLYDCLGDA